MSIKSLLASLQAHEHLTPAFRASVAWLILTGQYATQRQQESLALALDADDKDLAHQLLHRAASKAPRRVRSRRLVRPESPVMDVTRTVLETGLSGIPRIVRLLAAHAERHRSAALVVWVAGAPARVNLEADGGFAYPAQVWGTTRRWFNASRRLRKTYWQLMAGIARLPGGYALRGAIRVILSPFKLLDLGVSIPHEVVLLPRSGILEPEVITSNAADRLVAWMDAHPETALTVLVHDFLPLTHPQFFPRDQKLEFLEHARSLQYVSTLVVATEHLRDVALSVTAAWGRSNLPRVEVVPFPVYSHKWDANPTIEVESPSFYMVGSPDPRKNYRVALAALQILAREGQAPQLHIIGAQRGLDPELRASIRRARQAGASIVLHGAVSDDVVAGIAAKSLALVYISKAEGYGLPVREAQVMGHLAIASNIPSNRIFARAGGVVLVEHRSPTAVANAMRDVIEGRLLAEAPQGTGHLAVDTDAYCQAVFSAGAAT